MGGPIASNLAKSGLPLSVYDILPDAVEALEALGASPAASPADVARDADIIGICVVNDAQTFDVVSGTDGLLSTARPGSTIILHSSIHPDTCREVARLGAAQGVDVLDVPVSGHNAKAVNGELTLMIGGDGDVVARCEPYLSVIGENRYHLGPIGSGAIAKLSNNVMAILAKLATYEGLNVARASGIDVDTMVDISLVSTGQSESLRQWRVQGLQHGPTPGLLEGVGLNGEKDLRHALAVARERGEDLPVVAAVLDLMEAIRAS